MRIRKWVLAARPVGLPDESTFKLVEEELACAPGEFLVRTRIISVDPGIWLRLTGRGFGARLEIGDVIEGFAFGEVVESVNPQFHVGALVVGGIGWAEGFATNGRGWRTVDPAWIEAPLTEASPVGVLGTSGLTAHFGIHDVGCARAGETLLVSSAAGSVGSVAGQLGRIAGMRVVGIAGSDAKCAYLVDELGFDAAINYRTNALDASITAHCAEGVDLYFDNVGGATLDAALRNMKVAGRIVLCGLLAQYGNVKPQGVMALEEAIFRRVRMQGFMVFDFWAQFGAAISALAGHVRNGELSYREEIVDGFERLPDALVGVLAGESVGRRAVRV